ASLPARIGPAAVLRGFHACSLSNSRGAAMPIASLARLHDVANYRGCGRRARARPDPAAPLMKRDQGLQTLRWRERIRTLVPLGPEQISIQTYVQKVVVVSGTSGSNPLCSSGESCANLPGTALGRCSVRSASPK